MDNLQYYRRRLLQEEAAVRNATCEAARDRHEELASAYRLRSQLLAVFPATGRKAAPEETAKREIAWSDAL